MTTEVAKKAVLNLGRLEEDDLFEEFPVKGKNNLHTSVLWRMFKDYFKKCTILVLVDKANEGDVNIWEDNWDDDDIEDDFSVQLR